MQHAGCPHAARHQHPRLERLTILAGLASLIWFLVRVIPKPSRASYPCQRAAAPLASGFVIWFVGLLSFKALYRRAADLSRGTRYALPALALAGALVAVWLPLGVTDDAAAQEAAFVPSDAPNAPIGVGKGIFPGRVVWAHEPEAARWDGKTGDWWDDANTDQRLVSTMLSDSVRSLTGKKTEKEAWDALFRHFNQTHGAPGAGYRTGEKIAIKINENQNRSGGWTTGQAVPSPHMIYALVAELIEVAGVRGENITIYDASRSIGEPIVKKIRANANADFQAVRFVAKQAASNGQIAAEFDPSNSIHFADPNLPEAFLPKTVTEAKYLVNFALLRVFIPFGVTLTAKNHFGEVYFPNAAVAHRVTPRHSFVIVHTWPGAALSPRESQRPWPLPTPNSLEPEPPSIRKYPNRLSKSWAGRRRCPERRSSASGLWLGYIHRPSLALATCAWHIARARAGGLSQRRPPRSMRATAIV